MGNAVVRFIEKRLQLENKGVNISKMNALLFTVVVILANFSQLEAAECDVSPTNRIDCGYPGISRSECSSRGCCFDDTKPGTKFCFKQVCDISPGDRIDCGYPGISRSECLTRGCCYNNAVPAIWC